MTTPCKTDSQLCNTNAVDTKRILLQHNTAKTPDARLLTDSAGQPTQLEQWHPDTNPRPEQAAQGRLVPPPTATNDDSRSEGTQHPPWNLN